MDTADKQDRSAREIAAEQKESAREIAQNQKEFAREIRQQELAESARRFADDLVFDKYSYRDRSGRVMTRVTVKKYSPRPLNDMRFESVMKNSAGKRYISIIRLHTVPVCWRVSFYVIGPWWTPDTYLVFSDINGAYWKRREDHPVEMGSRTPKGAEVYKRALEGDVRTINGVERLTWRGAHISIRTCGG